MDVKSLIHGTEQIFVVHKKDDKSLSLLIDTDSCVCYLSNGCSVWRNFSSLTPLGVKQRLLASLRQKTLNIDNWLDAPVTLSATSVTLSSPIIFELVKKDEFPKLLQMFFLKLTEQFSVASDELRRLNNFSAIDTTDPTPNLVSEVAMKKLNAKKPGMSTVNPNVKKRKVATGLKYDDDSDG